MAALQSEMLCPRTSHAVMPSTPALHRGYSWSVVEITLMKDEHVSRGTDAVQGQSPDLLSTWCPFMAAAIFFGFAIYRGMQAHLPVEDYLLMLLAVIVPAAFTFLLIRKPRS